MRSRVLEEGVFQKEQNPSRCEADFAGGRRPSWSHPHGPLPSLLSPRQHHKRRETLWSPPRASACACQPGSSLVFLLLLDNPSPWEEEEEIYKLVTHGLAVCSLLPVRRLWVTLLQRPTALGKARAPDPVWLPSHLKLFAGPKKAGWTLASLALQDLFLPARTRRCPVLHSRVWPSVLCLLLQGLGAAFSTQLPVTQSWVFCYFN